MEKAYQSVIENQFKTFDNMLEGISVYRLIFNDKGEVIDIILEYMNRATIKTMDINPEKAIGKNGMELFSPEYLNPVLESINEYLKTGNFKRLEQYYVSTDKCFLISGFKLVEDLFAILRVDITEQKRSEKEIRYHALLLGQVNDAVIGADSNLKFTYWNKGAEEMFGFNESEALGKDTSILRPAYASGDREKIIGLLQQHGIYKGILPLKHKNGHVIITDLNITRLTDEYGSTSGYVVVYRDITEQKRAEIKIQGLLEETQHLNEELSVSNEELSVTTEELQVSNEELQDITEELSVSNEELQVSNEELRTTIEELNDTTEELHDANEELKLNEEELRKARDNLEEQVQERTAELELASLYNRSLIEASLDPLVTIGPSGKITDVNTATELVSGYSRDELIGTDFSGYFTDPQKAKIGYQRVFRKGEVRDYPLTIKNKNGHITPVLYNASVYRDESGEVIGVFAAARDITERKKAEKAVKAERQRFIDVMETLPAYLILLNQDYYVEYANRFFRERFGEDRGKRCYEYLFGLDRPCENCETYKVLKTNSPHHWEWTGPDERNYDIYDFPFIDTDGSLLIMEFGIDITERKKAEERLKETVNELKRSNNELQQFAYITSHDLQEPLRTIASYAQLIQRRYQGRLDSDADEFIDFMVSGATRMKGQIQGLLDYSRVGTQGNKFIEFSSEKALNHALDNLNSAIEKCNVELTYDPLPTIVADKNQITRVFQNLIGNALKFHKEGVQPKIHISSYKTEDGNGHVFSVKDKGIGIEEQYTDKIFEIFKRLHAIGEYQGAGIGLAIVKRIIDRHHGRIWVESELGKGSTFYFTIPIRDENSA